MILNGIYKLCLCGFHGNPTFQSDFLPEIIDLNTFAKFEVKISGFISQGEGCNGEGNNPYLIIWISQGLYLNISVSNLFFVYIFNAFYLKILEKNH